MKLLLTGNKQVVAGDVSMWSAAQAIQLFGIRVGIQTNQAEWMERLESHFPPLWQPVSAGVVDRVFSFRFGKTTHTLFENDELTLKARSLKQVLETFERQLKMYVAEMARRRVFVHAGAVAWNGKAIILPADSFSGKTTFVAEFVRRGAVYYSDEYAILDENGHVHPFPRPLSIRSESGELDRINVPVESLGGSAGIDPLPVSLVLLMKHRSHARWKPEVLSPGVGVLKMVSQAISMRSQTKFTLEVLNCVARRAIIIETLRGGAERSVSKIIDFVDKSVF